MSRAYGLPEFTRLLRTGIGVDGKEHGLMTARSRGRGSCTSPTRRSPALHAYLIGAGKGRRIVSGGRIG